MIDTTVFQDKTAVYYTLGCKLNFSETSTIGKMLKEAGVRTARRGEKADICVVNTCSVTEVADKKCRQAIHKLVKQHPGAFVVVFPSGEVIAPDIPIEPEEALPMLKALVEEEHPDIIIGTSMGGMYAQQMHGHLRICVNPSFRISTGSKLVRTGTYKWLNGRKDSQKEFRVTNDTLKHFNVMERQQFEGIDATDKELCYGLFGINDKVVNSVANYNTFTKYYTHAERFEGEHQLNDKIIHKVLLPLLKDLLGEAYEEARKEPLPDYMRY